MYSFIKNLVGVKADRAVTGAMEAIVRWDPQSATEAELRTMEQHLDALGRQVAEARVGFDKEKREADAIGTLSRQRMAAAEQIQHRMDTEAEPSRKAELERSLSTLVSMLETMAPDVVRENQDVTDAGDFLHQLESAYQQAGQKLKGARDDLTRAQRDMGRADQQREMAERRSEAARQAAGLSSATSGLNVALKAMQDNAARSLATADAANAKAKLLAPTKPEQEDPNIASAMAMVEGKLPAPTNLNERLMAAAAEVAWRSGQAARDGVVGERPGAAQDPLGPETLDLRVACLRTPCYRHAAGQLRAVKAMAAPGKRPRRWNTASWRKPAALLPAAAWPTAMPPPSTTLPASRTSSTSSSTR